MPQSEYRARQVGAKTHEVVDYHKDTLLPGKPLYILIPGGLVALAAPATLSRRAKTNTCQSRESAVQEFTPSRVAMSPLRAAKAGRAAVA